MRNVADETLVAEVQDGSISAFEELVRRYQGKLYRFVLRNVHGDHASAEDIVQETFISLYKTLERVDTNKKFSSYIFSIARNRTISYLRSRKIHSPLESAEFLSAQESPQRDDDLIEALHSLDKKYERVLSLYYFENLSYEEISKRLRFPLNTVRTHIKRAKEALRKMLT